jgi:hypothetical protein
MTSPKKSSRYLLVERGYEHKRGASRWEDADPSMSPSHMYQMWGSGGLYELLRE